MIVYKSAAEIETMDRCNAIVVEVLRKVAERVRKGVTTADLDDLAEEETRKAGAVPAFKGYRGFPSSLCTSINDEVIHGIPSRRRVIREGDLVSLDFGVVLDGYYGDAAVTIPVGAVTEPAARLLEVTRTALRRGVDRMEVGGHVSDISHAIQTYVEGNGFQVVREFVGHGIGHQLHEDPQVPNYGPPGRGPKLREGLVLAIEPIVTAGSPEVTIDGDQWTARSVDGGLSAHFERTVAMTAKGPRLLGGDWI